MKGNIKKEALGINLNRVVCLYLGEEVGKCRDRRRSRSSMGLRINNNTLGRSTKTFKAESL
jgi:hypothetical protein